MNQESLAVLPFSQEAERGILGCILQEPRECLTACEEAFPSAEVFYDMRHSLLYQKLVEMGRTNVPIDTATLAQRLMDDQLIESVGGLEYLMALPDATPSAANLRYFMEIAWNRYTARQIIAVCRDTMAKTNEYLDRTVELLEEFEKSVMAIQSKISIGSKSIDQVVNHVLERIKTIHDKGGEVDEFPTGFVDLDRMSGGLHPTEVNVVAGYPGSGKTSLAMNIAEHAVLTQGKSVVVFSLEMSAESLVSRFMASHAKVNFRNIKKGYLTPDDFVSLDRTAAALSSSRLFIEDDCDTSVYQIRAKARRLKQKHHIQLIVIDYIQLLSATGAMKEISSRQEEVAEISRTVKAMAREFNVPVVALSQLNDDGKLRESRAIGQDADNIWLLEPQKSDSEVTTPVKLSITKARNGPVGDISLVFMKPFTRFESAAKNEV